MANKSLKDYQKKVVEEVTELGEAITVHTGERKAGSGEKALADHSDLMEEAGDLLFSAIAVTNKLGVDSTEALEKAFDIYSEKLKNLHKNS